MEGFLKLDPKPGAEPLDVKIPLSRGATVRGSIVGPREKSIRKAVLLHPSYSVLSVSAESVLPIPVRNGRFELPGYHAASGQRVHFLDAENQLGASVVFDKKQALGELAAVRLAPCGSASVVLVDQDNRPWSKHLLLGDDTPLAIIKVEGIAEAPHDDYLLTATTGGIGWSMHDLAPERYKEMRTDAKGRVTLTTLIPGATYKLYVFSLGERRQMWREVKAFNVESGQNVDLGTVVARRQ
jgi:hypothetical protein